MSNKVIISLTSIKLRYDNRLLHKTLRNLINMKNYIIVLNISKDKYLLDTGFTDKDINSLHKLFPTLEINIVKNYGPLRKIIPTLQKYRDNIIITVDDDAIYCKNTIQQSIREFNIYKCIISSRCRYINQDKQCTIDGYAKVNNNNNEHLFTILPEGVGGILYHSSWFEEKFIYYDFMSLKNETCPYLMNDDLLLRAYTLHKNIAVKIIRGTYTNSKPPIGLYKNYNKNTIINFQLYIDLIKKITGDFLRPYPVP